MPIVVQDRFKITEYVPSWEALSLANSKWLGGILAAGRISLLKRQITDAPIITTVAFLGQ